MPRRGALGGRRPRPAKRLAHGQDTAPQGEATVVAARKQRRVGLCIGSVLVLIMVGVVGFGYYHEFYKPPRVWACSVNNVEFNMGDLVERIRVLQGVNRYQGGQVNLSTVPFEYLQNLIDAEILRQRSQSLGIHISDADIEEELRRQFVPTAAPGQETDPGQLEREFKDSYSPYLTATALSAGAFSVIVAEQLATQPTARLFGQAIEERQQHVEIQWIRLPIDGQILIGDVEQRLVNEDFTRIAQELNSPSQFADPNGYVGWVPQGAFPELDDYMFGNQEDEIEALTPGSVSEPIFTNEAYYLIKVLAPSEERDLTGLMGSKLLRESVDAWQREALVAGTGQGFVRMNFNSRLYEWVTDQVFITAPRIERPTPVPELLPGIPVVPGGG